MLVKFNGFQGGKFSTIITGKFSAIFYKKNIDGEEKLAELPRKYVPTNTDDIDWPGELKIFKNKPRAIEQATYLQVLPVATKEYLLSEDLTTRRERIKVLISLLEDYEMSEIDKAIRTAAEENKLGKGYIKAILAYGSQDPEPTVTAGPTLSRYDRLRPEGVANE